MPTINDYPSPPSLDGAEKLAAWKDGAEVAIPVNMIDERTRQQTAGVLPQIAADRAEALAAIGIARTVALDDVSSATAATLAGSSPVNTDRRVPFLRGYPGGATFNADWTASIGANGLCGTSFGMATPMIAAQLATGGKLTVSQRLLSGSLASASLHEFNAAGADLGSIPVPLVNGDVLVTNYVPTSANVASVSLYVFAGGAGARLELAGIAAGQAATVAPIGDLRAIDGLLDVIANRIIPSDAFTSGGTLNGSTRTFTSSGALIVSLPGFAEGEGGVLRWVQTGITNLKIGLQSSNSDGLAKIAPWEAAMVAPGVFEVHFIARRNTGEVGGAYPAGVFYSGDFAAIVLGVNIGTTPVTFSNVQYVKGSSFPPMTESPAIVTREIDRRVDQRLAQGGTTLAVPIRQFVLLQDSFGGYGDDNGTSQADFLRLYFDNTVPVIANAVGGSSSAEIVARVLPSPVSIQGNQIPALAVGGAAIPVNVVSTFAVRPITGGSNTAYNTNPMPGTYGGVPHVLTGLPIGSDPASYTLTRTAPGPAVDVRPYTPFIPDFTRQLQVSIPVFGLGQNDLGGATFEQGVITGTRIAGLIRSVVAILKPQDKQFLVQSVQPGYGNGDGSGLAVSQGINSVLRAEFCRNFIDRGGAILANDATAIGYTITPDDTADAAAGYRMRGLCVPDRWHPNEPGRKDNARLIGRAAQQLGFNVPGAAVFA